MNGFLLAALVFSPCISVLGPAVVGVGVVLLVLLSVHGVVLPWTAAIPVFLAIAAVPSAGWLGVGFLRGLFDRPAAARGGAVELLVLVMAAALALEAQGITIILEIVARFSGGVQALDLLTVSSAIISRIVICGAVVAFVVGLILALVELCAGWIIRSSRLQFPISLDAARQVVLIFISAAVIDLTIGLFGRELAPFSLLYGVLP